MYTIINQSDERVAFSGEVEVVQLVTGKYKTFDMHITLKTGTAFKIKGVEREHALKHIQPLLQIVAPAKRMAGQ